MPSRWKLTKTDTALVLKLQQELQLLAPVAQVLAGRGIESVERAQRFLEPRLADLPAPGGMADLAKATERLLQARRSDELVGVFGDYDVDGVTSAALVGDYLLQCGYRVTLRVARRDEGYGFGVAQADELLGRGIQLLVVTDCGTSDREAVGRLQDAGIDVIALDHHRVGETLEWPGFALVNPQRPDDQFPFKGLCSAGLAFYAMAALRRRLEAEGHVAPDPRETLDLVALGTIADVAPLGGANRILVARGLDVIRRSDRPGLQELLRLAEIVDRVPTVSDVGWRLGPRLNAPGRLGDADVSLQCLWQRDVQLARESARRCDALNEERKETQKQILEQAILQAEEQQERAFILAAGQGWHPGVIGIVAGRLVERYERPAAVVALEGATGRASARSVEGVDLFGLLSACKDLLLRFGGHAAAAGFSVSADAVEPLGLALHQQTEAVLSAYLRPPLVIDGEVTLSEVDFPLCRQLERLGPFGEQNREPVFVARGVRVKMADVVGQDHLKLAVEQDGSVRQAIGFGMGGQRPERGDVVDLAFSAQIEEFRGTRLRLRLADLQEVEHDRAE